MKPDGSNIEERLLKSAEKLDGIEAHSPDFKYFKDLVDREQGKLRREQRRQLILFVAVALALVGGLLFCMGNYQIVFIALQCAAFAGAIAGLTYFFTKAKRQRAEARE